MVTIRPMVLEDVPILYEMYKMAFLPLYERFHDKGNPYLRGPEDIRCRIGNESFHPFTVLYNDEIVGGIWYRNNGSGMFFDELKPGEYYLTRAFIHPEMQGKKIAQKAILLCEETFEDALHFYVDFPAMLEKNRRCYEAAGYVPMGMQAEPEPGLVLTGYHKTINKNKE